VNLRWEIDEKNPAIVNRIEIVGNDFTSEDCIRRADLARAGRSVQSAGAHQQLPEHRNMNFFESPMPFPD
jgi:outer membrane protein insertion porin family